ncbi:MAG: conjugal transfer protein TrbE [Pseudomonadota bacterium]
MFNLQEYRNKNYYLSDLLPWTAIIAPGTVLNKDGSFQRTIRFRGPDMESSTEPQLISATARLNNALKRLGSGWVIYIESQRFPSTKYLPECHFPDPISRLIDAERREQFGSMSENFANAYFLTLQWLPPTTGQSKLGNWFLKREDEVDNYNDQLESFMTNTERLFGLLNDIFFETRVLGDDEVLSYLHSTISAKHHQVNMPETPMYLDAFLADTPLVAGIAPRLGNMHLRTISVLGLPATSLPALLDQLNNLSFSYRWVTRYIALDKTEAEKQLKSYRRRWFAKRKGMLQMLQEVFSRQESQLVDNAAVEKAKDIDEGLYELSESQVSFGYYTTVVVVMDADEQEVKQKQRHVERVINGLGFTTIAETINNVEAWLSSLPGQAYANVRQPIIHSLNLAHLMPFSAIWAGKNEDQHLKAPALMQLHTHSRTPFRMVYHIGDVGHQMILGPTGAGKSVLLNFMALQFLRYEHAQVFVFDKGGSFLASTYGVGGSHYALGVQSENLAFQPLANIDVDSEKNWASEWLQMLLINEKISITPNIKQALWNALTALAQTPKQQRTLTGFCALLQNQELRQALSVYTVSGAFGQLLDSDEEIIRDERWQCYEMSSLMNVPSVIAPVLNYLFHRLEQRFDGSPTMLILDEAWLFLDHPAFAKKIREWLKSLRKQNVSVIFATQSVSDALNAEISSSLIESCLSRILLPNDRALEPQIRGDYEKLGLNDKQLQLLATAKPKQQYYYQSTIGNRLFDLLLQPIALAFCAASTPADQKLLHELYKEHGREGFVEAYLKTKQLAWAWDIIESLSRQEKTDE